jgi:hypothetical protein
MKPPEVKGRTQEDASPEKIQIIGSIKNTTPHISNKKFLQSKT